MENKINWFIYGKIKEVFMSNDLFINNFKTSTELKNGSRSHL